MQNPISETKPATRWLTIHPPVFIPSVVLLVGFIGFGVLATETAEATLKPLLNAVTTNFGWLYVGSVSVFIGFAVFLALSPYGRIRLGTDDDRPQFSLLTWFSMLFSAGMGIGLVFFGVAEPIQHYAHPPSGEGQTLAAAQAALPLTLFHWGIHAWAIYVVMGLSIAYFSFRCGLPLALRSCFAPLLGDRIHGWMGDLIDIGAVFGTLFGLATSLGLGAMQVSAGFHHLFGTEHSTQTQLLLIAFITLAATISLVSGVHRGIRRLSELNLILAGLLLVFVFFSGPTLFILDAGLQNVGSYVAVVFQRGLQLGPMDPDESEWIRSWTVFYWGWWIAWSPFVGMFVARISRGRTIREFVAGVLLAPTILTFVWFSVFGDTALYLERFTDADITAAVDADLSTAIYVVLAELPLGSVTALLAALVVSVFFVTSSDSASFVVDMLTSGGHPNPPVWQRVFWATAEGACAAVLLYAGGKQALTALQAAAISIGLPFCIVLLGMIASLLIALPRDSAVTAPGSAAKAGPAARLESD